MQQQETNAAIPLTVCCISQHMSAGVKLCVPEIKWMHKILGKSLVPGAV